MERHVLHVISAGSSAPGRPLQWPDLAEGRRTPRSPMAQQRRRNFLPLPAAPPFRAEQESSSFAVEAPSGCAVDRRRPTDRHRDRMVRARKFRSRRTTMATIGTFKKTGNNEFTGAIVTLSVQAKGVRIVPGHRRERPQPPRLCRPRRNRRRLGKAVQRGPRLSGPQARRSEIHRPDLRQPLRRRGRRGLQPHLVTPDPPQRRVKRERNAPPGRSGRGIDMALIACPTWTCPITPTDKCFCVFVQ
jgi:uncharacterized protein (DUF736 family)